MTITLRPARDLDCGALGAMMSSYFAENDWLPRLCSGAEDIANCAMMIDRGWVTVAGDGRPKGFLALQDNFVHALFVAPPERGQGVGKALLDAAKSRHSRLELWTFKRNVAARNFYRREGFAEVGTSVGKHSDHGLPEIDLLWERNAA
ncbi:GNAT family N-acetyltransferase [Donghicola tyrosinivorans]|uniref:Acetyltransferase (GNAT) family protein n=1 Tax=Donghicola tyrosinivorans TaxID=1652492 RepID=A0A2T0WQ47_9RHOB|nr:GNAT family N-acetyltransferase [Donghicola tyrosinivorans]PRY88831.1 acetyltransferase (GNAT) family protein [Donghicola tyrosinivorans]